jgi:hypothetical protein
MQSILKIFVLALHAVLAASCAAPPPPMADDAVVVPSFVAPRRGAVLVLVPPQALNKQFVGAQDLVEDELSAQIVAAGYRPQLLVKADFAAVWGDEVAAIGGIYDRGTGRLDTGRYEQVVARVARRISSKLPGSLVLMPRLVLRTAVLEGGVAQWDGQSRRQTTLDPQRRDFRWEGTTSGLSLELSAMSPDGLQQFKTFGGLVLPFQASIERDRPRTELRDDAFANREEIAGGVAVALRPLLRASEK